MTITDTQALRLALACVTALTVLRILALSLSGLELHGDEAQYWSWAKELDLGYFTKPPLIAWVIASTTAVCGDGEACVRLSSPLLHGATAMAIFVLGRTVGDPRVALVACLLWLTLPAVTFSSLIVSTDVPLLFCWAVAILALRRALDTGAWVWAVVAGVAIGFGLLAKYAMAYAFLGAALHFALSSRDRWLLRDARGWSILALALVVLSPNLLWNVANDFATVAHLGDNTNLGADPSKKYRVSEALEFLRDQLGVFGPIPFAILAWRAVAWIRGRASDAEKFLLAFALPPLVVITLQAFLSRANANWAATAYPTAAVLVSLWLVNAAPRWLRWATLAPHAVGSLVFLLVIASWPDWRLPMTERPLSRLTGWKTVAESVRPDILTHPDLVVLTSDRMAMASLLYYLRDIIGPNGRPVFMWDWDQRPQHHYELANGYDETSGDPALFITEWKRPAAILDRFEVAEQVRVITVTTFGRTKRLEVWHVAGFKGR